MNTFLRLNVTMERYDTHLRIEWRDDIYCMTRWWWEIMRINTAKDDDISARVWQVKYLRKKCLKILFFVYFFQPVLFPDSQDTPRDVTDTREEEKYRSLRKSSCSQKTRTRTESSCWVRGKRTGRKERERDEGSLSRKVSSRGRV